MEGEASFHLVGLAYGLGFLVADFATGAVFNVDSCAAFSAAAWMT